MLLVRSSLSFILDDNLFCLESKFQGLQMLIHRRLM